MRILAFLVAVLIVIAIKPAHAQEVNVSVTSKHYKKGSYNEFNPGLILTTSNGREWFDRGWRIGAYHNSHEKTSVLITRYFDFDVVPDGTIRIRVSYGAISGYGEVTGLRVTPAAVPSVMIAGDWGMEVFWLPGAFGLTLNLNVD